MDDALPLSILIIDTGFLTRRGLRCLLEDDLGAACGEAGHAGDALAQVASRPWDLVILEMALPHGEYLRILGEIRGRQPAARVLMTSSRRDFHQAARALRVGANGYMGKDSTRADILLAVTDTVSGRPHFGRPMSENGLSQQPMSMNLSSREQRVVLALGEGKRPTQIATELNLSVKTISTYKRRALNKLSLTSDADLLYYVRDHPSLNTPVNH